VGQPVPAGHAGDVPLVPGRGLLPAPDFRRAAFANRAATLQFWQRTSDPDRALRNLLERDRMFTAQLREEAGRLALPAIEVDATVTEDALVGRAAKAFGLC